MCACVRAGCHASAPGLQGGSGRDYYCLEHTICHTCELALPSGRRIMYCHRPQVRCVRLWTTSCAQQARTVCCALHISHVMIHAAGSATTRAAPLLVTASHALPHSRHFCRCFLSLCLLLCCMYGVVCCCCFAVVLLWMAQVLLFLVQPRIGNGFGGAAAIIRD